MIASKAPRSSGHFNLPTNKCQHIYHGSIGFTFTGNLNYPHKSIWERKPVQDTQTPRSMFPHAMGLTGLRLLIQNNAISQSGPDLA